MTDDADPRLKINSVARNPVPAAVTAGGKKGRQSGGSMKTVCWIETTARTFSSLCETFNAFRQMTAPRPTEVTR